MREKFTDEIRTLLEQSKSWAKLEIAYAKLTLAEKGAILLSTLALCSLCLLLGMVVLIMLSFALAEFFMIFLAPVLAYLCVAAIISVFLVIFYLCRKSMVIDPVCKFITRLFVDKL